MRFSAVAAYHETAFPVDGAEWRRAVLVTYSFPPDTSIGAVRWRKMAWDFAARRWLLDVVTVPIELMPGTDPSSLEDLPAGVRAFSVAPSMPLLERVHRVVASVARRQSADARRATSATAAVSATTRTPSSTVAGGDAWSIATDAVMQEAMTRRALRAGYLGALARARLDAWIRPAAAQVRALAAQTPYDFILSSGPPHVAHLAGRLAGSRLRVPLAIDLRDPWLLRARWNRETTTRATIRIAAREERSAVAASSLVVLNTEASCAAMRARYPQYAERMIVVRNGSDHEPVPPVRKRPRFTIAYAGALYLDRSPVVLFRALRRVVDALKLTPDDIAIEMVGSVFACTGTPTMALAEREGIAPFVHLNKQRLRAEAREFLARAHVLVSLPWEGPLQVPAKVYEIVDYPAWVLVFAPPRSAPAELLRGTRADVVGSADDAAAADVLIRRYRENATGVNPTPVNSEGRLDRSHQARVLLDAMEGVIARR